ncbi:MAG TPA: alpha/beta hydrolase [Allosphingosinicella sp.]
MPRLAPRSGAMRLLRRAAAVLLLLLLLAALLLAVEFGLRRPYTPALPDEPPANAIASLEQLPIRGVPQSVLIRGRDRTKPILLFLHGGPGMPVMFLGHAFQRGLERDFVVVHWDRRGAGRSYDSWTPEASSVRATLDDLHALTAQLKRRFRQDRVYLVGHSWGTYLGLLAVHERPDLFSAYIGTGQMAADPERVRAARQAFFEREARARGDEEMLGRLAAGGEITEDDLFRYGAELRGAESFWPILMLGLRAPEYRLRDVLNVPKGSERLLRTMRYDVIQGPLDRNLVEFRVPIFFFLGRHDWNEPSTLAADYLRRIRAPDKGLVWFEHAAHFPFLEQPERFHGAMSALHRRLTDRRPPTP